MLYGTKELEFAQKCGWHVVVYARLFTLSATVNTTEHCEYGERDAAATQCDDCFL